ncbi:hypothetical protein LWI28_028392 [Acer negundo]|uniref:Uncharacterized protein n=1 Tax=Acer negundo TaxID=4023 RepID=A0AAD5NGC7_ACENE|nr:hypothetical protein LWI28_028392 [Acer negundo]
MQQILQNFEDILRKNQCYLQDKGKLKSAFAGLVSCLSLLPCNKRNIQTCEKGILHAFEPDVPTESAGFSPIIKKLKDLVPVLVNCFQEFIPLVHSMLLLDTQSFDCMHYILQSIDLAVGFFVYGIRQGKPTLHGGQDGAIWDQTISLVLLKRFFNLFPLNATHNLSEKFDDRFFILNILIAEIFLQYSEWICPPVVLLEKFLEFIEDALLGKAFTMTFEDCSPESSLKLACLSAIEEMLVPTDEMVCPDASDPLFEHQIIWIRALPVLLILLDDKHPSSSQVVLHLLLRLGQRACMNSSFAWEYDNTQYSLSKFYSSCQEGGEI